MKVTPVCLPPVYATQVFQSLGFEVEIYRDCDRKTILSIIKETAAEDHSQADSLVCIVFSHGDEGRVFGVDGRAVMLQELTAPFTGSKCPSLAGKPKMFFIQACQGEKNNDPVTIEADSGVVSDAVKPPTIPSEPDFLLAKSTVPTFCTYGDPGQGFWFIQSLCGLLFALAPRKVDLLSILTRVNEDVSAILEFVSSLRKKVIIPSCGVQIQETSYSMCRIKRSHASFWTQDCLSSMSALVEVHDRQSAGRGRGAGPTSIKHLRQTPTYMGQLLSINYLRIRKGIEENKEDKDMFPTYAMKSEKRGTCLIINNVNFKCLKNREATEIDEIFARSAFPLLGFEVEIYRDCDRRTILSIIKETAAEDHSQVDSLVCMVFSHGDEGRVFGVDGGAVMLQELTAPFTGSKCPSLAGKPKMFFIQAFQGEKNNDPVTIKSDRGVVSDAVKPPTIPSEPDFLLAKSTVPTNSTFTYGDPGQGFWFIQSLCVLLRTLKPRKVDLLSILTRVIEEVSDKEFNSLTQMPEFVSSLRKKVII
ncbi:caspase-8-like isoform X2 [Synchiropus splendidus]|uniref:caspase-8-like isoform X2 n=1 Tax=Synchiropus splendidus TaxID=270530 RepID=UPI00237ECE4A|nr:caspase-8-like isoform X2 [Synchiropus splendidus]